MGREEINKGEKNGMWKGNNAKRRAIQAWITNNYGKASKCENDINHKGLFVWKSISGKYLRDKKDYKEICQSCNIKESYDKKKKSKKEYEKMKKEAIPLLKKEVPIREISRSTNITRHKIKDFAKREGFKTDFRKRKVLKNRYYYIRIDGKYFMEHRIVVENYIGRKLLRSERVHHINEIKTDNRIENLMLFENDSKHIKFHTKIKRFGMTNPIKRQIKNRWKEYQNEKPIK